MTTPDQAAQTSRDTTSERIYPASQLEAEALEDRAEFGATAWTPPDPPRPVRMRNPIADVTKPPKGTE